MNNCIVKSLVASVSDSTHFFKYGELKIERRASNESIGSNGVRVRFNKDVTLHLNSGVFENNGGTSLNISLGQEVVVRFPIGSVMSIPDKYSLLTIELARGYCLVDELDIVDLADSPLAELAIRTNVREYNTNGIGKISSLEIINFNGGNVIGDIQDFTGVNPRTFFINGCKGIYGNILTLRRSMPNVNNVNITNTNIEGNIAVLDNLTNLTQFKFGGNKIYGDVVAGLKNAPSLTLIHMERDADNSKMGILSGNLAELLNVKKLNIELKTTRFVWSGTRPSSATILAFNILNSIDNVDEMLINQSQCQASSYEDKQIRLYGERTSASDSAISILTSKGYNVVFM